MAYRRALARAAWAVRLAGYVLCAIEGWMICVATSVFTGYYGPMGAFLLVGALLALVGSASGRWAPELIGLPLLASSLVALAVLTTRDASSAPHWAWVPSVMILGGFGTLMWARWLDLLQTARGASWVHAQQSRQDPGG